MLLLVGDDWAEEHHDVEVQDEHGRVLGKAKLPEGITGIARLHAMIGRHVGDDEDVQVVVGIETDRGPWVLALVAAGYQVYPINPLQVARYRERHGVSGAKSDPATRTPWPTWSAPTGTSYARRPGTASSPRRSRS